MELFSLSTPWSRPTDNKILRKLLQKEQESVCYPSYLGYLSIIPNLWTLLGIKRDDLSKLLTYTSELKSSSEKLFHKFWTNLRSGKILEKIGYSPVASIKKVKFYHQDTSIKCSKSAGHSTKRRISIFNSEPSISSKLNVYIYIN